MRLKGFARALSMLAFEQRTQVRRRGRARVAGSLGVKTAFVEPWSYWENDSVESFNPKLREELLDGEVFYSLKEARMRIGCPT